MEKPLSIIVAFIMGAVTFSCLQSLLLPCGKSCKQAYVRSAIADPSWSKAVWEDIAKQLTESHHDR